MMRGIGSVNCAARRVLGAVVLASLAAGLIAALPAAAMSQDRAGEPLFVDARRIPADTSRHRGSNAEEERQRQQERREMQRALGEAAVRQQADAGRIAVLESLVARNEAEAQKFAASIRALEQDIAARKAAAVDLQRRLDDAIGEAASASAALGRERARLAALEGQLARKSEKEAFDAALATARRLAAEAAVKNGPPTALPGR